MEPAALGADVRTTGLPLVELTAAVDLLVEGSKAVVLLLDFELAIGAGLSLAISDLGTARFASTYH